MFSDPLTLTVSDDPVVGLKISSNRSFVLFLYFGDEK